MTTDHEKFYTLRDSLESDTKTSKLTEILEKSLYYYCSGKDATPISVFGTDIEMYVYSDSFVYMDQDFDHAKDTLYKRINKLGFSLETTESVQPKGNLGECVHAELTLWKNERRKYFTLLYTQSDSVKCFERLYITKDHNIIQPKAFCNYRYELPRRGILEQTEKNSQYILGHCFDPNFSCIGTYPYLGDYTFGSSNIKVNLYEQR